MNKNFTLPVPSRLLSLLGGCLVFLAACQKQEVAPQESESTIPQLLITEFMAANASRYPDPATGEYDDWIEIYNNGNKPVNLAGLYFSDNKGYKSKYKIPATNASLTTVQPGAYLILWADSEMAQGELHLDFKLSAEGEDIGIYTAAGQVIDEVSFGPQTANVSTGRHPQTANTWVTFAQPTPGAANK